MDITYEDRFLELVVDNRKIAVFHGDYQEIVQALVTCGTYDAVFHGHTHKKVNETKGKTLSLNPGSLMKKTRDEVLGASFAIYDTVTNLDDQRLLLHPFVYLLQKESLDDIL